MVKITPSRAWILVSVLIGSAAAWGTAELWLRSGGTAFAAGLWVWITVLNGVLLSVVCILAGKIWYARRRSAIFASRMMQMEDALRLDASRQSHFSRILQTLFTLPQSGFKQGAVFLRAIAGTEAHSTAENQAREPWVLVAAEVAGAVAGELSVEGERDGEPDAEESKTPGPVMASLLTYLATPAAASGEVHISENCFCDPSRDLGLGSEPDSKADLKVAPAVCHGHYLVPLVCQGQVEGAIFLTRDGARFGKLDLMQFLQSLGRILGSQLAAMRAHRDADRLAFTDTLTNLPNRRRLLDRLQDALQNTQKSRQFGAFLLLDLDHFKPINDLHGHSVGDQFLRVLSQRLLEGLRRRDTVGRYAGDEFGIVLEDLGTNAETATRAAERVAEKVRALIAKPVSLPECRSSVSASLGLAIFPSPGQIHADEVLRQADIALYRSKEVGRDCCIVFEASMSSELRERRAFDQPLRGALERREFSLQREARSRADGQLQGAVVLLRWEHPELGHVPPEIFIPLAEESGAILVLGEWVLRQSCILLAQMAVLPYFSTRAGEFSLSVNVSPRQLRQPGFVAMLQKILEETAAPPSRLILEVPESQFLSNMDSVISTLKELRSLGVRISIDDFGTGYSCLFYLQKLPLDELKIDQSFIQSATQEPIHAVLIDTILTLSRQLGLAVVAE